MDEKSKESSIHSVFKYWWFIFKRAYRIGIKESDMKGWIKGTMLAGIAAGILWVLAKNKIIPQNAPVIGGLIDNFYVQLILGVGAIIIFGIAFFFALIFVPPQEHDKQVVNIKKLENELKSETLNIRVDETNFYRIADQDGKPIFPRVLNITNLDAKNKLVELQASIFYLKHTFLQGIRGITGEYDDVIILEWEHQKNKVELLPEESTKLIMAKLGEEESHSINFGISNFCAAFFEKESVFVYQIRFQGRYENEWEYRKCIYSGVIYSNPYKQILAWGNEALILFSNDMPKQLIDTIKSAEEASK